MLYIFTTSLGDWTMDGTYLPDDEVINLAESAPVVNVDRSVTTYSWRAIHLIPSTTGNFTADMVQMNHWKTRLPNIIICQLYGPVGKYFPILIFFSLTSHAYKRNCSCPYHKYKNLHCCSAIFSIHLLVRDILINPKLMTKTPFHLQLIG